jgi:nitroreductase
MAQHPTTGFDLAETDRLLTTTKQVRKRLDLTRPVPYEELLECIDLANHAPMGGNLERNRWMIIDEPDTKAKISEYFGAVGRPYLQMNAEVRADDRSTKVIDSATFHLEHEAAVAELLEIPPTVTQVCLLAVGYYSGDAFTPAPRRRRHLPEPLEASRRVALPQLTELVRSGTVDHGRYSTSDS